MLVARAVEERHEPHGEEGDERHEARDAPRRAQVAEDERQASIRRRAETGARPIDAILPSETRTFARRLPLAVTRVAPSIERSPTASVMKQGPTGHAPITHRALTIADIRNVLISNAVRFDSTFHLPQRSSVPTPRRSPLVAARAHAPLAPAPSSRPQTHPRRRVRAPASCVRSELESRR